MPATAPDQPASADAGFIDVHAAFGPDHGMAGAAGAPLATLVELGRRHGIRLTLASSLLAATADLRGGNRLAIEAAADPANRLLAVAVVAPRRTGGAEAIVREAEAAGVCGYRIEGWHPTGPPPEPVRELLGLVARTGRPLLVPLSWHGPLHGFGEASAIGAATADLGIPVVLLGAHYNHVVDDLAAAVRYPHLHLETSALAHWRAVETAVATIGAERLLLGTGSPRRPAASPVHAVLLAAIPDAAKRAILAGNAARLFGVPPGPVDVTSPPLPARAWDVHTHLGPLDFDVPQVADGDLADALLVGSGGRAVASAAVGIFADPARGNDQAVTAAGAGGPLGYVVADPRDLAFTEDQLRRHLGRPGMVGVKVHGQVSGVPTASTAMRDLFALLARFGRPVKIHNDGPGWADALLDIARTHPKLPIVIAHAGPGTPTADAGRLAASADHVYLELSSSFASLAEVRAAVRLAPPERLLWGSDAPLLDPAFVHGTYADAGIDPSTLGGVFWDNAAALYGGS